MRRSDEFAAVLARVVARLRTRDAMRAMAGAGLVTAPVLATARSAHASLTTAIGVGSLLFVAAAAGAFAVLRHRRSAAAAAQAVERSDPSLRNLVITAEELARKPVPISASMRARVMADAARRLAGIDVARAVPLSRDGLLACVSAIAIAAVMMVRLPARGISSVAPPHSAAAAPTAPTVIVDLEPPAYTGRPGARLREPAALDVLAGTQATVRVEGLADADVRLNGTRLPFKDGAARAALTESGYLAVEAGPLHRLLPLTVTPDRAPDVKITTPARDLRLPDASTTVPIAAQAEDDLGLRLLEIRYTVVSGTGEQFTFTEGTLPVSLSRSSEQSWRAEAALVLPRLKLEPGDALIYRAVAADRRPGETGVASSDTFFVEIAGPGDVPLEGVEMPPDKERYALSQAMIVLKIQRLIAKERSLPRAEVEATAANIAAEQRAVRANFIFLLGGEVEDEQVEAETSHEIQEGRLANQARREIVNATVLMGRVERELAAVAAKQALPPAQDAVKALQRAFGHSRYLLRALPSRVRIDPARRLSGDLASAADWTRALAPISDDPATAAARAALMDLVSAMRALEDPARRSDLAAALTRVAERMLSIADRDVQGAARDVLAARDAVAAGQIDRARASLQRAAGPIVARAQSDRIDAARVPRNASRLAGAAGRGGLRP